MKVLVTGSRGMLGTDLVRVLAASHEVEGWDVEELDITSRNQVLSRVGSLAPQVVINAAAYTDVDASEREERLCFRINAEGVENLALACREHGARLVHVSTDYVYDGQKGSAYVEDDVPHPLGVYGRSKLEGEERARSLLPGVCIVRTAWLYGRAGRNFVKAILSQARAGKTLRVVSDQEGSPTYTVDLARALVQAAEQRLAGIYHVTNRGKCTWFAYARHILDLEGMKGIPVVPINTQELDRPAPRPANSVLSCSRFEAASGMSMRAWQEALREYLAEEGKP